MRKLLIFFFAVVVVALPLAAQEKPAGHVPDKAELDKMIARFAPTPLRVDTSHLSAGDKKALAKLIAAARVVNDIFMQQMWSGNHAEWRRLRLAAGRLPAWQRENESAVRRHDLASARLHYFWMNKSPWSELDEWQAFLPDVPPRKLAGANFYPEDMTKDEFEKWVNTLYPESQEYAKGFFTVIRRDAKGKLEFVPYSTEYQADLQKAARLLREAAALTDNASLKKFLTLRAEAFTTNNYLDSDMAWMDLDAPLDITFGPYEVYNDEVFNYKASFEAFINLRDDAETAKLGFFSSHLQEIEDALPEDPQYRNPKLGALSPIRVVDEVFAAGDANHGIATAAYNLPNDDRVVTQKGSKRVMLKNVQEAKFNSVLKPIAAKVLTKDEQGDLSFDAFFTWILAHELTHGIGPHQIKKDGKDTNPRAQLKENYSAIEEAKADITGLVALQYWLDHKAPVVQSFSEKQLYTTYLASSFRTLRFGTTDAHGRGMAIQFNFLKDKGAIIANADGTFSVDFSKIKEAVRDLDHEFLTLEATGDYAGAKKLIETMGLVPPELKAALAKLGDIPVDIEPQFVTAEELTEKKK